MSRRTRAAVLALTLTASAAACGTIIPGPIITLHTPAGTPAQKYAAEILANPRIAKTGRLVLTDLKDAAAGKPSSADELLSATLLRLIAMLGQNHSFTITALETGGTGHKSDSSLHYFGDAVDFDLLDGHKLTGRDKYSVIIINELAKQLPSGSGFGEKPCGPKATLPAGIKEFNDTCDHLHMQVPEDTP